MQFTLQLRFDPRLSSFYQCSCLGLSTDLTDPPPLKLLFLTSVLEDWVFLLLYQVLCISAGVA